MDNIRLRLFDAGGRDDSDLPRLLEWPPKFDIRESDDAYRVYDWLPRHKHMIAKRGVANRNKALRPKSARQLEQATNANKALRQERGYADTPVGDSA